MNLQLAAILQSWLHSWDQPCAWDGDSMPFRAIPQASSPFLGLSMPHEPTGMDYDKTLCESSVVPE